MESKCKIKKGYYVRAFSIQNLFKSSSICLKNIVNAVLINMIQFVQYISEWISTPQHFHDLPRMTNMDNPACTCRNASFLSDWLDFMPLLRRRHMLQRTSINTTRLANITKATGMMKAYSMALVSNQQLCNTDTKKFVLTILHGKLFDQNYEMLA